MIFGSVPRRPHDDPPAVGQAVAQPVRRAAGRRHPVPGRRPASTAAPPSCAGGASRSRSIAAAICARSSTRTASWSVACRPYSRARSSSSVGQVAALRLERRGELGDQQQRRDAVLVAHAVRVDAVAERLLVAERAARRTRAIHLKPVSVSAYGQPVRRRDLAEQRRRHDRRRERRRAGPGGGAAGGRASSAPTSSPRSIRQPLRRRRDRDRAPVGVGVVGQHEVGVRRPRAASARSIAPGSSGFGNATVGKSGSGSRLLGHDGRRGEAGPLATREHHARRRRRAAACRRSAGRAGSRGRPGRRPGRGRRRARRRRGSPSRPRRSGSSQRPDGVDRRRDLCVGRRHDLRPSPR